MDTATLEHLDRWLVSTVRDEDARDELRQRILSLVEDDPQLLDSHGWTELRDIVEYDEVSKQRQAIQAEMDRLARINPIKRSPW